MNKTILLVDDEENITASLVRLLHVDGYRVLTANSAGAALEQLANNKVGVILTDQRMPKMTGVELLSRVKELYPDTVRMILSGYADLISVTDAVNKGAIYKFLTKPWNDEMLRANVHEAFMHYKLAREKERLGLEIQSANAELTRLNEELEQLIEEKSRRMMHISNYDALTNLPNRLLFADRLQQALRYAQRNTRCVALMSLDLDRFKIVNDSLGHPHGDALLQAVAKRLINCVREIDTLARVGGDEFMFILSDLVNAQDAADIARKILDVLADPFVLEENELFISASIGISLYPSDGEDTTTLVKNADAALYHAKKQGRNNYQYYAEQMNATALQRLTLESSLRHALEREEFVLYYQPQLELESGAIIGVEALLRWQSPERGLVEPAAFIPLLEETGLIVPVGEWVLRNACAQNIAWQREGLAPIRVSINLSALQFRQPDFAETIARILRETGLDAGWEGLELELTESLLINNVEETIKTLCKLHAMNIKVSIDDFGTGYSSLNYLKRFPLYGLKIDQSFVRDLSINPEDAAIVAAIIALGHSLKLNVIAEGVETLEQLKFLRELKCDEMQGYLFSPPMPAADVAALLRDGRRLHSQG
ncbi:MAG TPA: EAL domain-containing protein [Gammaproteobacteria bacterium]|nr:EAL domain-containing protein [Gammaproteobacteria bacterium]